MVNNCKQREHCLRGNFLPCIAAPAYDIGANAKAANNFQRSDLRIWSLNSDQILQRVGTSTAYPQKEMRTAVL